MLRCAARTAFNEILPNGVIVEKLLRVDTSATVTGPWPAGECHRAGGAEFLMGFPTPPAGLSTQPVTSLYFGLSVCEKVCLELLQGNQNHGKD